jgi:hypothetical protein
MPFIPRLCSGLRSSRRLAPALAALALAACGSSGTQPPPAGTAMMDANNYKATSQLHIPVLMTASGQDLTVDWSSIMKDLLCHTARPIQSVTFATFPRKTQADLEAELSVGVFNATEVSNYFIQNVDASTTMTKLSSMGVGTKLNPSTDFVESSSALYLMLFSEGQQIGVGAESMVILKPMTAISNTAPIVAPDGCGHLDFSATLGSPLSIPKTSPYTVNWNDLTKDGFGNAINFANINGIEVGYYQSMSASDLQMHFLDVEVNATNLYTASFPKGTKSFDLTGAKTSSGMAFSGFTDGTWALALRCSSCSVPAPVAFTILSPQ